MDQKLVRDSFLILVNNPKHHCMQEILLKIRYFEKELSKPLFFLLNPVPFNGKSYQKQKGHGTSDQSLFRLQSKFRKIALLVINHQTKFADVI